MKNKSRVENLADEIESLEIEAQLIQSEMRRERGDYRLRLASRALALESALQQAKAEFRELRRQARDRVTRSQHQAESREARCVTSE